jgi:hypothetical protein
MARPVARSSRAAALQKWIPPQLTQLADAAPDCTGEGHRLKLDAVPVAQAVVGVGHGKLHRDSAARRIEVFAAPHLVALLNPGNHSVSAPLGAGLWKIRPGFGK